jgi:hypothetical protein
VRHPMPPVSRVNLGCLLHTTSPLLGIDHIVCILNRNESDDLNGQNSRLCGLLEAEHQPRLVADPVGIQFGHCVVEFAIAGG